MRVAATVGIIVTFVSMCACQLSPQDSEIISATQSTSQDFPSTGALIDRYRCGFLNLNTCYSFHCSGTLIAPNIVLTAGHCVQGKPLSEIYFTLNVNASNTTSSTRVPATQMFVHPNYNGADHDLAVVYLDWAPGSTTAQLITPAENALLAVGARPALSGYGATGFAGSPGSKFHGESFITALAENTLFLSTYQPGAPICYVDAGGPAYILRAGAAHSNVIAGVAHHTDETCTPDANYARVAADLMWIHQAAVLPCDSGLPCSQRCGDFHCDSGFESHNTCPHDCASPCGDHICDSGESCDSCPQDCGSCGCPAGYEDCGGGSCCTNNCTLCIAI